MAFLGRVGGPRRLDGSSSSLAYRFPRSLSVTSSSSALSSAPFVFPELFACLRQPPGAFHASRVRTRTLSLGNRSSSSPPLTSCSLPTRSLASAGAQQTSWRRPNFSFGLQERRMDKTHDLYVQTPHEKRLQGVCSRQVTPVESSSSPAVQRRALHASAVSSRSRSRSARVALSSSPLMSAAERSFSKTKDTTPLHAPSGSSKSRSRSGKSSTWCSLLSGSPVSWTKSLQRVALPLTWRFASDSVLPSDSCLPLRPPSGGLCVSSCSLNRGRSFPPRLGRRVLLPPMKTLSSNTKGAVQAAWGLRRFAVAACGKKTSPQTCRGETHSAFWPSPGLQCMYTSGAGSQNVDCGNASCSPSPEPPSSDNVPGTERANSSEKSASSESPHSTSGSGVRTPQPATPAVCAGDERGPGTSEPLSRFAASSTQASPSSDPLSRVTPSPSGSSVSRPASSAVRPSPLHEVHASLGAKFVKFHGLLLPFAYEGEGVVSSHLHTRTCASLFDLAYRQHYRIRGDNAAQFLERLVVGDIQSLLETESRFTLFTNEQGGIEDDVIVAVHRDFLLIIGNACNKSKILSRLDAEAAEARGRGQTVTVEAVEDYTLLSVQGPQAMDVMSQAVNLSNADLVRMPFMSSYLCSVEGVACVLTRCGFSGEDGFEISLPASEATRIFSILLEKSSLLRPAGVGARDTLRQEAGLCQFDLDIDEQTTPVEAALGWTVSRRRRQEANFPGAARILAQLAQQQLLQNQTRKGPASVDALQKALAAEAEKAGLREENRLRRKRVGLCLPAGGGSSKGVTVREEGGKNVGIVTSSCFAPSLQRTIGMAYLDLPYTLPKTRVVLDTNLPTPEAQVCQMPFLPGAYYKVPLSL
uniref:Glycine cleavage T-protein (Aminomethyl transferase) domain-containing protein n=1 Tax=Toxoplasma gondii COUG TaxID=1074873 RepID=A0A2G8XWE7_TOXGO|nr:glycine cleavage T-protein (aminomethyl transferase) domain-containing protein [Toxoplasma gondii COUG]